MDSNRFSRTIIKTVISFIEKIEVEKPHIYNSKNAEGYEAYRRGQIVMKKNILDYLNKAK